MTWVRHRPKRLAWTVLAAILLVIGQGAWRWTRGGVPVDEDLVGVLLRVVVLGLLVAVYLRSGGETSASRDGLVVHDGVRRRELTRAQVRSIEEDRARNGAVAVLQSGGRLDLPGVTAGQVRDVRRALKGK